MIRRVAFLSYHTCPLIPPGSGDAGGMNVYINELASIMASRGIEVDVFTRRTGADDLGVVEAPGGYRVIHVTAGPYERLPKVASAPFLSEFADAVAGNGGGYDLVHSHYWLSGWAGLLLKRRLGLPLANSFHTLGRVKDASRRNDEPPESLLRIAAEHDVLAGSDCVVASTPAEAEDLLAHYGADPTRLCISPPGVNHDVFTPGDRRARRAELGIDAQVPVVLFVGRVQPLKGIDVVVGAFARIRERHENARLVIIGGPSGPQGSVELTQVREMVDGAGLAGSVDLHEPVEHQVLARYYQSADVLLVPSRSESFGLVAVEAQACGLPVVAANVGGLSYAVADGSSGFLVEGWNPSDYAAAAASILRDEELASRLSKGGIEYAEQFSWEATANRFIELYEGTV
ncbi:MAG: glycosyltransferase [Acidimicrobiia bacterium]|nr:glycosyltransferase [Acidimicrobiia bacterium]